MSRRWPTLDGVSAEARRNARTASVPWDRTYRAPADSLSTHLTAPHLVDFAATMGDRLDDAGLSIDRVRRIA
jgi:hypothetical protein